MKVFILLNDNGNMISIFSSAEKAQIARQCLVEAEAQRLNISKEETFASLSMIRDVEVL